MITVTRNKKEGLRMVCLRPDCNGLDEITGHISMAAYISSIYILRTVINFVCFHF